MPSAPDYHWPAPEKRRVIGKPLNRIDGLAKASGRIKYSYDIARPGLLYGAILTCPHAHARVKATDTAAAEKSPGVTALVLMAKPGEEIQYAGYEVAAVAATTEDQARDALRKIKVEYEVLPHFVNEQDLAKAGDNAKPSGQQSTGDPDTAFQQADVISEGFYGVPVLNHCTLETHGQVCEWKGDQLDYWPSTQAVASIGGELAKLLEIPVASVHTHMDAIGGAFGSKFSPDRWGEACARLSKKSGGRPVKLFLDRATELAIAGNRPAYYARIKTAAKKDGTVTAWDARTWGTGGFGGVNLPPGSLPYVFRKVPNVRLAHTSVSVNAAMERPWRAPNNPQFSYLTCCAMEDLAAKLNMDPVEFFTKNADLSQQPQVYRAQLAKAAELAEWKKLWRPRGESGPGPLKQGLGIGFCTWWGMGHESNCRTTIHPDGSVELELASQDLGTGTRTVIAIVASETLGVPPRRIKVRIGDNKYPESGPSGGSTTVGGVSASTRKSTMNALYKLFEAVAPALGAQPEELEAAGDRIQVRANPAKGLAWSAACRKLGAKSITEMGVNNPRSPGGLTAGGVGGVQIAHVGVDVETGIVRMNRMVAVQDCGMVISPKTAESQVYGGCIMSICGALMEERIMDSATGRVLNTDLDTYKLAGIGDVGEIIVYLNREPEHDRRGVVGLGEPPVIGGLAAIANAVANAIGVRVPVLPLTPNKVLAALEGRNA
ncbi:MAG: xanthine dehydrogenase family protein molybdopterin-binding subunit [Bryobacteraceae bacterium]|jgi:xanthine dehydrogenase YagR molybdenum-binding subunit